RDVEAGERARQRGLAARVVDFFLRAARQATLGAVLRALRARTIDLLRPLGAVGEDDHLVVPHFREPAGDRELVLVAAAAVRDDADAERGEKRRVAGQHAEVSFTARRDDLVDGVRDHEPHRRRDLEREPIRHYLTSRSFFALSSASPMSPTM